MTTKLAPMVGPCARPAELEALAEQVRFERGIELGVLADAVAAQGIEHALPDLDELAHFWIVEGGVERDLTYAEAVELLSTSGDPYGELDELEAAAAYREHEWRASAARYLERLARRVRHERKREALDARAIGAQIELDGIAPLVPEPVAGSDVPELAPTLRDRHAMSRSHSKAPPLSVALVPLGGVRST